MLALLIKSCVTVSNYWKFDELRIPAKVWTLQWTSGRSRPKKHADSKQRAVSWQQITYRQQKRAKNATPHISDEKRLEPNMLNIWFNELIWTHFCFRKNGLTWERLDRAAWSKRWASLFWKRRRVELTGASSTVAPGMLSGNIFDASPWIS